MVWNNRIAILLTVVFVSLAYLVGYQMGRNTYSVMTDSVNVRNEATSHTTPIDNPSAAKPMHDPVAERDFLAAVQQTIIKTMQEQVHKELKPALEAVHMNPSITTSQSIKVDTEAAREIVNHTNQLVDDAILRGHWNIEDDRQLSHALQTMPSNELFEVQKRLSHAINQGKIEVDIQDLLYRQ